MGENESKSQTPAYVPYKTFINFINVLRESGTPSRIDRSIMRGMSGSAQSAITGSLEFLNLVTKSGEPTTQFHQLIDSTDESRGPILRSVLERSYPFLFSGSLDLKRATTKQVEEAFRSQGITGSTVVKCIAFFLSAAKAAAIPVSPHVKTPTLIRVPTKRVPQAGSSASNGDSRPAEYAPPPSARSLRLPLVGKEDVVLVLPEDFDEEDWRFLKPILEAYIGRLFSEQ
jgi:hypothetical protein